MCQYITFGISFFFESSRVIEFLLCIVHSLIWVRKCFRECETLKERDVLCSFPGGGGGGVLVVSLMDVNFRFWSRLGCFEEITNIFSLQGLA